LATARRGNLTDQRDRSLKSYVYFRGHPRRGFGKASVNLDPVQGRIYYVQGEAIHCVDLAGRDRVLARLPADQVTAFTHVECGGPAACACRTTDAHRSRMTRRRPVLKAKTKSEAARNEIISDKPAYDIDERVRREHLNSW